MSIEESKLLFHNTNVTLPTALLSTLLFNTTLPIAQEMSSSIKGSSWITTCMHSTSTCILSLLSNYPSIHPAHTHYNLPTSATNSNHCIHTHYHDDCPLREIYSSQSNWATKTHRNEPRWYSAWHPWWTLVRWAVRSRLGCDCERSRFWSRQCDLYVRRRCRLAVLRSLVLRCEWRAGRDRGETCGSGNSDASPCWGGESLFRIVVVGVVLSTVIVICGCPQERESERERGFWYLQSLRIGYC